MILNYALTKKPGEHIGIEFNGFMAYVRRQFGKVSCCRVFESFENGYPHIHCILLFQEHSFSVFRDNKGQFRVHEKDIIAQGWHSNVDVKVMSSLAGSFSYLKKYLLKKYWCRKWKVWGFFGGRKKFNTDNISRILALPHTVLPFPRRNLEDLCTIW